jgi:hypothetical protein
MRQIENKNTEEYIKNIAEFSAMFFMVENRNNFQHRVIIIKINNNVLQKLKVFWEITLQEIPA